MNKRPNQLGPVETPLSWNGDPVILEEFCEKFRLEYMNNMYDGPTTFARLVEATPTAVVDQFVNAMGKYTEQEVDRSWKVLKVFEETFAEKSKLVIEQKALRRLTNMECSSLNKVRQYCINHSFFVQKTNLEDKKAKELFINGLKDERLKSLAKNLRWKDLPYHKLTTSMTKAARCAIWKSVIKKSPSPAQKCRRLKKYAKTDQPPTLNQQKTSDPREYLKHLNIEG